MVAGMKKNGNHKILLILRHAKSSWKEPDLQDHDRPLNSRGKGDAPRMGKLLMDLDLVPDHIISSTAKRAKDTANAIAETSKYQGRIDLNHSLYASSVDAYLIALRFVSDDFNKVLIVGHNPVLEELVNVLTGKLEHMSTCAMARIDPKIRSWRDLCNQTEGGQLMGIWRPREL
jgi:phosphohistidine phosphatase